MRIWVNAAYVKVKYTSNATRTTHPTQQAIHSSPTQLHPAPLPHLLRAHPPAHLSSLLAHSLSFVHSDVDAPEDNPIVYCEICQCGVHAQCYGYPLSIHIPTDEWICQSCLASPPPPPTSALSAPSVPQCCLCPVSSGLLKRTTCGRWCHISCALWIPEVFFRVSDGCDAIDVSRISGSRYGRHCQYCSDSSSGSGSGSGVCSECSEGVMGGCGVWYHITCGMRHGVLLEYRQGGKGREDVVISYCAQHAKQFRRRGKAGKGQGR